MKNSETRQSEQAVKQRVYFLLDGAMMGGVQKHLPTSLPKPAWLYPLADHDDPNAGLGPILVDAQAAQDGGQLEIAHALCLALPSRLHVTYMHSHLTVEQMIQHLRQFTKILLEDRQAYWLRFTDCRVLLVLSTVLTADQWCALTAPMVQWEMHLRDGTRKDLPLAEAEVTPVPAPLILSDAQMEACMEAQEPDILLRKMGYTLDSMKGNLQDYWDRAKQCIDLWLEGGSGNRDVLDAFARQVFENPQLPPQGWEPLFTKIHAEYGAS